MLIYRLTPGFRREVCVHEAAHAVMGALGGTTFCYALAVAPEGAEDWSYTNRKGWTTSGIWGNHEGSDPPFPWPLMRWNEEEGGFDGSHARGALRDLMGNLKPHHRRGYYRSLRAHLCFCLAGNIAEALYRNEEPDLDGEWGTADDIAQAEATSWLLPFRWLKELDHGVSVTTAALREYWPLVTALADVLEAKGVLNDEEVAPYLPQRLKDWPPPPPRPKAKKAAVTHKRTSVPPPSLTTEAAAR